VQLPEARQLATPAESSSQTSRFAAIKDAGGVGALVRAVMYDSRVSYVSAGLTNPSRAAWAAATVRVGAPSFASTAETWWSTVLAEMNS